MTISRSGGGFSLARVAALFVVAWGVGQASAGGIVTYDWVTDSVTAQGTPPTSASFQVDLAVVQTGQINSFQITNIQFAFPGIGPLSFTAGSSIGLDNTAYVDPITGLPVFHDNNQGLAAVAYQGALFSATFLSITFDQVGGDQFNAINGGPGSLGFGRGHWTAAITRTGVPEPSSLSMLALGGLAVAARSWSQRTWRGLHLGRPRPGPNSLLPLREKVPRRGG
ncbi:MAG: PEP-CTERM sorting domain-containing protein [Paludisphaera borealis]|uniref:PEP-CTERM sorting domain-containing protein n=1 Tax=Paludisphaera borealis TaxID=1387353 RepID=UPI002851251C|nr:PEP-CTERM sorting domain-containing protein [Paludisphaera borealis]MDR3622487.1 PEP-CTERM sorting domain-containing protein [Paludisphaera borealis]